MERIVDTGPTMPRVEPADLARALGAEHDWELTGSHATGASGGKTHTCSRCGWKHLTHSNMGGFRRYWLRSPDGTERDVPDDMTPPAGPCVAARGAS